MEQVAGVYQIALGPRLSPPQQAGSQPTGLGTISGRRVRIEAAAPETGAARTAAFEAAARRSRADEVRGRG
jgi:hypothetical protein